MTGFDLKTFQVIVALLAAPLGSGCKTVTPSPDEATRGHGSVAVKFSAPDRFTDFSRTGLHSQSESQALADSLRDFIEKQGSLILPASRHLEITIKDINLAGITDPFSAGQIRVTRTPDRATMEVSYRLTDAEGGVIIMQGHDVISGDSTTLDALIKPDRSGDMAILKQATIRWLHWIARN